MDFETYHHQTSSTAVYPQDPTLALLYVALGLAGEAGEVANKVKKVIRDDAGKVTAARRTAIGAELGDLFWYLSQIMHELEIDPAVVLERNVAKLQARRAEGTLQGEGDERGASGLKSSWIGSEPNEVIRALTAGNQVSRAVPRIGDRRMSAFFAEEELIYTGEDRGWVRISSAPSKEEI